MFMFYSTNEGIRESIIEPQLVTWGYGKTSLSMYQALNIYVYTTFISDFHYLHLIESHSLHWLANILM